MDDKPELTRLFEELARRDREAAILVAAWPGRVRLMMEDDVDALIEVMEG